MQPVTWDSASYLVDGKPVYLNSGEFHYFRVPKSDWRRRMTLLKEAGGNCLATYVPWVVHEPEEGRFSFGEREYDDLEGFLGTAAEMGLYVIARPGPYQYSELLYAGLPHWLCDRYPEILARDIHGKPYRFYSVSYLHPLFLEKARAWYERVCPILAKHTVSRGGPIAFTQIDNEFIGIHVWYGGLDYNADAMGIGKPDGRYTRFLEDRYGDVAALSRLTGLSFSRFEDVRPLDGPSDSAEALRRRKDYFDFYLSTVAEYARTLGGWMRELGIDTPIVHNSAGPSMNASFTETVAAMGNDFLLGSDHYYNLSQDARQNNPTPQYAVSVFASNEMLRLYGFPPTIFELPSGSLSDWPPITASDAKAFYLANLALGMKGHNYYIFTGGPNPPGMGATGDTYDYGAPIGADGEVRWLYSTLKSFGLFIQDNPWLARAEREFDCRFALDWEMSRAERYCEGRTGLAVEPPDAWRFLLKGPLTTAFCASMSPAFVDLDSDEWVSDRGTPVVIVCASAMSRARQESIVRFLSAGGTALFAPVLPEVDENLLPCTVLSEFLHSPRFRAAGTAPTRLTVGDVANIYNNGRLFFTETLPSGAEVLGRDECSGAPVAWELPLAGGGRAVMLGFQWLHAMREHERMLDWLLTRLGLRRKVSCTNPNVWTSLRTDGKRSMLFIMNLLSSQMETSIDCQPSWADKPLSVGTQTLGAMTVKCVELNAPDLPRPAKKPRRARE
jgi:beta-galactosidase